MRVAAACWIVIVACASAGCAVRTAADPARLAARPPAAVSEDAWPQRYAEPFSESIAADPAWGGMQPIPPIDDATVTEALGRAVEAFNRGPVGPEDARGHLTLVHPAGPASDASLSWSMMYLYRSWAGLPASGQTLVEFRQRFGDDGRRTISDTYGHITRMALFEPTSVLPRGLVVHLTGLTGMHPERAVIHGLTDAGWAVLCVEPPNAGLVPSRHRVFHLISINVVTANEGLPPESASQAEPVGLVAAIAEDAVTQYVAELAYAVEAGLDALAADRPDIPQRPLVLAGFSMGAIALPAVAARLETRRIDAAVLAGGGANILRIARESSLGVGLRATIDGRPLTPAQTGTVEQTYAQLARLDPLNAADALAGVPVLMLHARFDRIVPAGSGELLYDRLGRPERWTYPAGHLGLYWLLGTQADDIARWIARAVGPSA